MSAIHTAAKVAFWLGIFLAITSFYSIATGGLSVIVAVMMVTPLMLPYLYLMFAEGRDEARSPAKPAE